MNIVFDSQAFRLESRGGISRYVVRLAQSLSSCGAGVEIVAPIHRNYHLREAGQFADSRAFRASVLIHPRIENLISAAAERIELAAKKIDIFHPTFYGQMPWVRARARVLTVHDMIHERFADWHPNHPLIKAKAKAVRAADHIICISESTRNDVIEILGISLEKTSVVYHGNARLPAPSSILTPTGPYLLFVGQRHRHKNFGVILDAVGELGGEAGNLTIVAFGGYEFNDDEISHAKRCGLPRERLVRVTGDDSDLAAYYRDATAFVYPSHYEGFGMPLLEAMSLECPVICSASSCMPEIAKDAALFFNPESAGELANCIMSVMEPNCRAQLIGAGKNREKEFSWARCAAETMSAYANALG